MYACAECEVRATDKEQITPESEGLPRNIARAPASYCPQQFGITRLHTRGAQALGAPEPTALLGGHERKS